MSRPVKCRRVCFLPGVTYFKPAGIPLRFLSEVCLSLEEAEAIRLKDLGDLEQKQCAEHMNISRPTFQRVLASARRKISDALLNGKAIRIDGGFFEIATGINLETTSIRTQRRNKVNIAVITDDEVTVSQHFGRASWYVVYTVEGGKVTGKEKRPKMGHSHFAAGESPHAAHGSGHGYDAASQKKHASMAEAITDCQVLIAGGMGMGAYDSMKSYNIDPIVTDVTNIDEAVKLYLEGKLPNLMTRLH
jgi:predicted DNA-binding protein (UPF0251 family)/predicted Fe-Mo cluster-binding NifX family protein